MRKAQSGFSDEMLVGLFEQNGGMGAAVAFGRAVIDIVNRRRERSMHADLSDHDLDAIFHRWLDGKGSGIDLMRDAIDADRKLRMQ